MRNIGKPEGIRLFGKQDGDRTILLKWIIYKYVAFSVYWIKVAQDIFQ
jgi:hypothetical protein